MFVTYLTFSALFNYYACVLISPGNPEEIVGDYSEIFGETPEIIDGRKFIFVNESLELQPGVRNLLSLILS